MQLDKMVQELQVHLAMANQLASNIAQVMGTTEAGATAQRQLTQQKLEIDPTTIEEGQIVLLLNHMQTTRGGKMQGHAIIGGLDPSYELAVVLYESKPTASTDYNGSIFILGESNKPTDENRICPLFVYVNDTNTQVSLTLEGIDASIDGRYKGELRAGNSDFTYACSMFLQKQQKQPSLVAKKKQTMFPGSTPALATSPAEMDMDYGEEDEAPTPTTLPVSNQADEDAPSRKRTLPLLSRH